jgi:hypothetical protein
MTKRPTTEELMLVVRHGSGAIERALATVQLAKRRDRLDELRLLVDANGDTGRRGDE